MAKMTIDKGYFTSREEVLEDIARTGFWPTTYVSEPSPELPLHHHGQDIIGYVMRGESYVLDENGERLAVAEGDRLVIPEGAWHAEGEVRDTMVYIVTLPEPLPFLEALMPLEPKGPWPAALSDR